MYSAVWKAPLKSSHSKGPNLSILQLQYQIENSSATQSQLVISTIHNEHTPPYYNTRNLDWCTPVWLQKWRNFFIVEHIHFIVTSPAISITQGMPCITSFQDAHTAMKALPPDITSQDNPSRQQNVTRLCCGWALLHVTSAVGGKVVVEPCYMLHVPWLETIAVVEPCYTLAWND